MYFRPKYAPEFVVLQGADNQMVIENNVVSGMKSCEIRSCFNGIALQSHPFYRATWPISHCKINHFGLQYGSYYNTGGTVSASKSADGVAETKEKG